MPKPRRESASPHDRPTERLPWHKAAWPEASPGPHRPAGPIAWPTDRLPSRARRVRRLILAVGYLTGLIQGGLALRVFFQAIGANPAAPVAGWIEAATTPLLYFFEGLFPVLRADSHSLEIHTLFAIVLYTALGFGLKRLLGLWLAEVGRGRRV